MRGAPVRKSEKMTQQLRLAPRMNGVWAFSCDIEAALGQHAAALFSATGKMGMSLGIRTTARSDAALLVVPRPNVGKASLL